MNKSYEITSEINALNIKIKVGDFIIEQGEKFFVESNMKNLSIFEDNGVLTIVQKSKIIINSTNTRLKLYVPKDILFEQVDITTGAAELTTDSLSANVVQLKIGAGRVRIGCLNAYTHTQIEGGVGNIIIESGTLHDVTATLGVGDLKMVSALRGQCALKFGVGKSNLTLIGGRNDYKLDIKKGIGSIAIKDNTTSANSGEILGHLKISGGIGDANIVFQDQ